MDQIYWAENSLPWWTSVFKNRTIQAMGRTKRLASGTYLFISISLGSNPDVQLSTVNPKIVRTKFFAHAFPYGRHLGLSVFCTLSPLPSLILLFVLAGGLSNHLHRYFLSSFSLPLSRSSHLWHLVHGHCLFPTFCLHPWGLKFSTEVSRSFQFWASFTKPKVM